MVRSYNRKDIDQGTLKIEVKVKYKEAFILAGRNHVPMTN